MARTVIAHYHRTLQNAGVFGQMSVNTLLHVYGDKINTKPMCQK